MYFPSCFRNIYVRKMFLFDSFLWERDFDHHFTLFQWVWNTGGQFGSEQASSGAFQKFSLFPVCIHHGQSLGKVFRMSLAELPVPIRCVTCNTARSCSLSFPRGVNHRVPHTLQARDARPLWCKHCPLSTEKNPQCWFALVAASSQPLLSAVRWTSRALCF